MEEKVIIQSENCKLKKPIIIFCAIYFVLLVLASFLANKIELNQYWDDYTKVTVEHLPRCEHTGAYVFEREGSVNRNGIIIPGPIKGRVWKYNDSFTYDDFFIAHPTVSSFAECAYKADNEAYKSPPGTALGSTIGIGLGLWLVIFIALLIINSSASKSSVTVTNMRVYGVLRGKKRVDLPIDSITAFAGVRENGIAITTSSGKIRFNFIKNRDDIADALISLITERQSKKAETKNNEPDNGPVLSNADEIRKYKNLLDEGIITQEDYDAKKKQLLGL